MSNLSCYEDDVLPFLPRLVDILSSRLIVSYTRNWVCDIALIACTLSLGKIQEGSGFQGEGHKGTMGDKGSQFTSNLGLRWTIPVTAVGSQVSKREYSKGSIARGNTPYTYILNSCSCTYWND